MNLSGIYEKCDQQVFPRFPSCGDVDHFFRIKNPEKTIILQVTYHSWKFDDEDIDKLDKMFNDLGNLTEESFLFADKLSGKIPNISKIFKLNTKAFNLMTKVNPYLGTKMELPRF